jgi:hypothetical protein
MGFSARDLLFLFTVGWLGGLGLMAALTRGVDTGTIIVGLAQGLAAVLLLIPRTRAFGYGAMLSVLTIEIVRGLTLEEFPGALVFYGAVLIYLLAAERERQPAQAPAIGAGASPPAPANTDQPPRVSPWGPR